MRSLKLSSNRRSVLREVLRARERFAGFPGFARSV
jgi:hypothetical protein